MNIKINDKNGITLKTKDKFVKEDIVVTIDESLASGGASIEEVTELPEATAENVGKIYKYQGELYECKEYKELAENSTEIPVVLIPFMAGLGSIINVNYVDSEPSVEDMLPSDMANMLFELYILNDGTNGWGSIDGIKIPFADLFMMELNGVCNSFDTIPVDNNCYLVKYYDNVPVNNDILTGYVSTLTSKVKYINISKNVTNIKNYAFWGFVLLESVKIQGSIYNIDQYAFRNNLLKTIDISNTKVIPTLYPNAIHLCESLSEIKVPQALLEEFKTATNWSEYADLMVGV